MDNYELITILGPTACGKTALAAALAARLDSEVISADSRQVYRRMDIGTGKDFSDYTVNGRRIPYHLIDIREPGEKYNVFEFQHDFFAVFETLRNAGKIPILCGGTGMYIEAVLRGYKLLDVPPNPALRESLKDVPLSELERILAGYKTLHNKTDVDSAQRAIRAIEIEEYYRMQAPETNDFKAPHSLVVGLDISRELRRERISRRLRSRLDEGMAEEVRSLLNSGLTPNDLIYYGLEYKYVTQYVTGELSYDEMLHLLEIAIHRFAKRQMTWFRGMERRGIAITWIDAGLPTDEKIDKIINR
ncbi:MAG: tRNA (adenosine(37)-N6)-dimethylallyltransferase MiaA [Tannerella sp.]|nr:tRNA (adenosine(37)-N6)-dimethylallyltransferase MiaA [Tannerella sp.]